MICQAQRVRLLPRTFFVLALVCTPSVASILHVDVNLSTGANDGTSWSNAFQGSSGLASALSTAVAGDEIWVAYGMYKPTAGTSRTIAFNLRHGVEVYGGFQGNESLRTQRDPRVFVTTLSGDLSGNDSSGIYTDNSFHVVDGATSTISSVLDGFTIDGGNADTAGGSQDRGGGLLLERCDPALRNLIVRNNRSSFGGGAAYMAQRHPTFENVRFEQNFGGSFGGACHIDFGSNPTFSRCVFIGNAAGRGGAVEVDTNNARFSNCLFTNNSATASGGGGAVYVNGCPRLRFCTVVDNSSSGQPTAGIRVAGGCAIVANSIIYFNNGPGGTQTSLNNVDGATVTYSCVQGGYAGNGNGSFDPLLVGAALGDYRISSASPCIDAGDNAAVLPGTTLDLEGHPRFVDDLSTVDTGSGSAPIADMGAYEFQVSLMSIQPFCFGDGVLMVCPCANNGLVGNGCSNSVFVGGARLSASGAVTVSADSLSMTAHNLSGDIALFFQGATEVAPTIVDDGLGCVGSPIIRLGSNLVGGAAAIYPDAGNAPISVRGAIPPAGGTYFYQCFYRNAASAFCPPATSNRTNGLAITWTP